MSKHKEPFMPHNIIEIDRFPTSGVDAYIRYKRESHPKNLDALMQRVKTHMSLQPRESHKIIDRNVLKPIHSDVRYGRPTKFLEAYIRNEICVSPYYRRVVDAEYSVLTKNILTYDYKAFGSPAYYRYYDGVLRWEAKTERLLRRRKEDICISPSSTVPSQLYGACLLQLGHGSHQDIIEALSTSILAEANSAAYDAASEIAEGKETAKYIADIYPRVKTGLKRLYNAWRKMKNPRRELKRLGKFLKKKRKIGHLRRVPDPLQSAANYWLEYTYGIKPLMYSIADIAKAQSMSGHKLFQTFRDRDVQNKETTYVQGNYEAQLEQDVTIRVYVKQLIDADLIRHKYSFWIPTAIWEVVPYSFVIDWFVGVGDYLQSLRPFVGQARVTGYSVKIEERFKILYNPSDECNNREPLTSAPPDQRWFNGFQKESIYYTGERELYKEKTMTYRRVMPHSLQAYVKLRSEMTWKREISAAALLYTRLKRTLK